MLARMTSSTLIAVSRTTQMTVKALSGMHPPVNAKIRGAVLPALTVDLKRLALPMQSAVTASDRARHVRRQP